MVRYNMAAAAAEAWEAYWCEWVLYAKGDAEAIQSLWKVRQQQLEDLRVELQYVISIKGLLNACLPPVLSGRVLAYLG